MTAKEPGDVFADRYRTCGRIFKTGIEPGMYLLTGIEPGMYLLTGIEHGGVFAYR